jgi:hypothetical protein
MAMALLKVLLVVLALAAIGYSIVAIDLPNQKYYWIAFEVVVAILLIPVAIGGLKSLFGGRG